MRVLALIAAFYSLIPLAPGHGLMTAPNPRGTLANYHFNPGAKVVDPNAPIDFWMHFPAGDKGGSGTGIDSQLAASQPDGWTPFEPLKPGFKWRAGVCGDTLSGNEHLKGGKYYHGGMIVEEYKQGEVLKVELNIVAHHNGFIELHLCDVQKCGGEISERCFQQGHCYQLMRARNSKCDDGNNVLCAPIDPNYPGRWYLPCSRTYPSDSNDSFGSDDTILYMLPENLHCDHCVLHFFMSAANTCNPPGVVEFFEGPSGPNWPKCPGQAGAIGGYTAVQAPCGGIKLAEEYYSCADIRIAQGGMRSELRPTPTVTTEDDVVSESVVGSGSENSGPRSGIIKNVVLIADGRRRRSVKDGDEIDISRYREITFQCVTREEVPEVEFYIRKELVSTETSEPYYMFGDSDGRPSYWREPIINRRFKLVTRAGGDKYVVRIKLMK